MSPLKSRTTTNTYERLRDKNERERMINGSSRGAYSTELVKNSALYKEFLAERREILCHKWIESEKAGYDIGFERALIDWVVK